MAAAAATVRLRGAADAVSDGDHPGTVIGRHRGERAVLVRRAGPWWSVTVATDVTTRAAAGRPAVTARSAASEVAVWLAATALSRTANSGPWALAETPCISLPNPVPILNSNTITV